MWPIYPFYLSLIWGKYKKKKNPFGYAWLGQVTKIHNLAYLSTNI